ncbi:MAG: chorismate mutase [Spirochaetia bacterium]|nr:chorismate mutase [Spirochaetia bacterium]
MELEKARRKIDEIDLKITKLLNKRFKIAVEIGEYKGRHGLPVFDSGRENELLTKIALCADMGFENYMQLVYMSILSCSKEIQKSIAGCEE